MIDFKRDKRDVPARVSTIEYDPNRSARIALLVYADGEKRYILQPQGLAVGSTIVAGETADILPGNALPLGNMPLGTIVHNVELRPGKGGQLGRSAGSDVSDASDLRIRGCVALDLQGRRRTKRYEVRGPYDLVATAVGMAAGS